MLRLNFLHFLDDFANSQDCDLPMHVGLCIGYLYSLDLLFFSAFAILFFSLFGKLP
jgi:hypothetical protein